MDVRFLHPVTGLCGTNGCGKSTLLQLAALAFHRADGHIPRDAPRGHYVFSDFFYSGPGDPNLTGLAIRWSYGDLPEDRPNPLTIQKRSDKWMQYERRPARPVTFIGVQRVVPAIERR